MTTFRDAVGRAKFGLPLATLKEWVASRDRSECWDWPFGVTPAGYGELLARGRSRVLGEDQ